VNRRWFFRALAVAVAGLPALPKILAEAPRLLSRASPHTWTFLTSAYSKVCSEKLREAAISEGAFMRMLRSRPPHGGDTITITRIKNIGEP